MANTTARLYIRSAAGYTTPPKKLVDLPTGQTFYLVWHEGARKRARSVGRFADRAHVALINQQSVLRKAAINPHHHGQRNTPLADAPEKPQLADAITEYLNRVKKSKKHKTFLAYKNELTSEGIVSVAEVFHRWESREKLSKVVTLQDVREADFNLSPSLFVNINDSANHRGMDEILRELLAAKLKREEADRNLEDILGRLGL